MSESSTGERELANILWKEPESKRFYLCGPCGLSQLLNSVLAAQESSHR